MKKIKLVFLILFSSLISLLFMEILVRYASDYYFIYDLEMHKYALKLKEKSKTKGLTHEHQKNKTEKLMGVEVSINDQGFRGADFNLRESINKNEYRILIVGSSITMGWGVEYNDVFTTRVQNQLNSSNNVVGGKPINIINMGIGNYNTLFQKILLKKQLDVFKPNLVVLHYFINDAETLVSNDHNLIVKNSYIAALAYVRMKQLLVMSKEKNYTLSDYYLDIYSDDSEGWIQTRKSIEEIQELLYSKNIDFCVLIQPELNTIDPNSGQERSYDKLREFLKKYNIKYYDLKNYFDDYSNNLYELWIQQDDTHPNSMGHSLMANGLYDLITNLNE